MRPAAPAAFIPTPSGSSSRAAEKSPARPRPRVNPKVHDRMLEVIEELEDEGAKAALLNILFPDADDDPMSEDVSLRYIYGALFHLLTAHRRWIWIPALTLSPNSSCLWR